MAYLADESVDRPIVSALRQAGYDVVYVSERWPGMSDPDVLARAQELKSVLLTGDKDFGAQPRCCAVQVLRAPTNRKGHTGSAGV